MRRATAVREALHRVRARRRDAHALLATIGGADLAVAVGILVGATARRTPILVDGPVGVSLADRAGERRLEGFQHAVG